VKELTLPRANQSRLEASPTAFLGRKKDGHIDGRSRRFVQNANWECEASAACYNDAGDRLRACD
jgi:hypothetical protein